MIEHLGEKIIRGASQETLIKVEAILEGYHLEATGEYLFGDSPLIIDRAERRMVYIEALQTTVEDVLKERE